MILLKRKEKRTPQNLPSHSLSFHRLEALDEFISAWTSLCGWCWHVLVAGSVAASELHRFCITPYIQIYMVCKYIYVHVIVLVIVVVVLILLLLVLLLLIIIIMIIITPTIIVIIISSGSKESSTINNKHLHHHHESQSIWIRLLPLVQRLYGSYGCMGRSHAEMLQTMKPHQKGHSKLQHLRGKPLKSLSGCQKKNSTLMLCLCRGRLPCDVGTHPLVLQA